MSGTALAILNPTSGKGRAPRLWRRVRRGLEARFPHVTVHQTTEPGDAGRRAAEWCRSGQTGAILVVGGDGTIHEVVNGLAVAGGQVPLGVIPAGTGNDFARNAGIPLDADLAAERLGVSSERLLDLGHLRIADQGGAERDVVFVNSCSVGVSTAANRHARWLGYVAGGVAALLTEPRGHFTVRESSRVVHEGKALNITLANGPGFGRGMRISPDSSPWDGVLERVIIDRIGVVRALLAFSRLKSGNHLGMRGVSAEPARGVTTIESAGMFRVEADGHEYHAAGQITVSLEPSALRVLGVSG